MATTNKKSDSIFIQIDNEVIELTGQAKEAFIAEQNARQEQHALLEAEYEAKRTARANAINKLAEIAGLTEEEINSIL